MGGSRGIAVGETAPNFTAPLTPPEGTTRRVELASFLDDGAVLLVFYPNDFTPDCVREWCAFRDDDWFTANEAVSVVGVSRSRPFTHRKFIDLLGLGFPLYSDGTLISEAYGVDDRTFGLVRRPRRSCFLVDRDRTVRYEWVAEGGVDPTTDVPDVHEIHRAVVDHVGGADADSFGFA